MIRTNALSDAALPVMQMAVKIALGGKVFPVRYFRYAGEFEGQHINTVFQKMIRDGLYLIEAVNFVGRGEQEYAVVAALEFDGDEDFSTIAGALQGYHLAQTMRTINRLGGQSIYALTN